MRARRLLGVIVLAMATSVALVAPAAAAPYESVTGKVKKAQSFSAGAAAFAGDIAGKASTAGFVAAGGTFVLLYGAGQLMFARRRRSSGAVIEPNG